MVLQGFDSLAPIRVKYHTYFKVVHKRLKPRKDNVMKRPMNYRWLLEIETLDFSMPTTFNITYEGKFYGKFSVEHPDKYVVQHGETGEMIPFGEPFRAFCAIDDIVNTGEWQGE